MGLLLLLLNNSIKLIIKALDSNLQALYGCRSCGQCLLDWPGDREVGFLADVEAAHRARGPGGPGRNAAIVMLEDFGQDLGEVVGPREQVASG